jgi:hypothetical protein
MLNPHADVVPHVRQPAVAVSPPRVQQAAMPRVVAAYTDELGRVDGSHVVRVYAVRTGGLAATAGYGAHAKWGTADVVSLKDC